MEADRFQRLSYSEEQFRTETGAVLGEYYTIASNPTERMVETLFGMAFTRHTYGHTTMGKLEDICRMPTLFEHSRSFFRRFYTPDNAIVLAVGDVDHAAVMELVRRHYGSWRGRRDRPRIPVEPEPTAGSSRHLDWRGSTPPRMMVGYRIPAFDPARRGSLRESAALRVVHGLAFHESSPLYQRLVVDERSVLELGSWDSALRRDPFLFFIAATLAPGTSFDPVLGAIQEELGRIGEGAVPPSRIDAVKSHIRYATVSSLETPADAAELLASFVAAGGTVEGLPGYLDALAAVSPEEVAAAARRYLVERRRYVVTLSPSDAAPEGPTCESLGVER
jgi:zinc protease